MAALRKQLTLDFSQPSTHAEAVHQGTRHGTVIFWERATSDSARWIKCGPQENLPAVAEALRGTSDSYFTVNQFQGWRQVRLLKSLRAVYVDLDGQEDLDLALEALASAQMPAPSFVVWSGRGLHLYWLLRSAPAQALPVWQRMQDALIKSLATIGADPACRDCTRILRLAGTRNSKNNKETRGLILTGTEWDMHTLADEILGARKPGRPPKAKVHDFDAMKARKGRKSVLQGSIYGWWHTVYSDLVRLTDVAYRNRVPEGKRDKILFLHAVALSWFAQPDAIADEILSVGQQITDLPAAEILQTMAPVIDRRNDADRGHKITWNGLDRDPRYFFKADTLRKWLGDDLVQQHADVLRALAPAEVIKQRKAQRDRDRWSDHNTGKGYRIGNETKRATAILMKSQGVSIRAIAAELGMSYGTVYAWVSSEQ